MNIIARARAWLASIFARYELNTWSPDRTRIRGHNESATRDMDFFSRDEAMRRARNFEQNNALVQGMLSVEETYTVGRGLCVSPNTTDPKFNALAKGEFEKWAADCEVSTRQSLYESQSIWSRRRYIDGDIFVLKISPPLAGENGVRQPPKIQTIEAHLVRTPPDQGRNPLVQDGARVDPFGRPAEWFIGQDGANGKIEFGPPKPATTVIQILARERAGQVRGMSDLVTSLNEIHDLADLHLFEMRNAKNNADVANVVINQTGEAPSVPSLIRQRIATSETLNTGSVVSGTKDEHVQIGTGGKTAYLKSGSDFKQFRSENPSAATREFWRMKTELACIGGDIPYVLVFPNSMQGTVVRGTYDTAAAKFRARSDLIAAATMEIYHFWLEWAVRSIPSLRTKPADYKSATISAPRAPNVDVGRNASAEREGLNAGTESWETLLAPRGLDWRAVLRAKAEQAAYIRALAKEFEIEVSEISQTQQDKPERIPTEPRDPMPHEAATADAP